MEKLRLIAYAFVLGVLLGCTGSKYRAFRHVDAGAVRVTGYPIHHEAIERMKRLTVLISNEGFGGGSRGTGVLVDNTHVLTCAHMIPRNGNEMWVFLYPGRYSVRAVVERTGQPDLALLRLDEPLPVSEDGYAVFNPLHRDGEPLTVIGNMLGSMHWMVTYGVVSGDMGPYVLTDALIHGGNSGGPWINEAGEIVALTDWGLQSGKGNDLGVSGGIDAATLLAFLYPQHSELYKLLEGMGEHH